MNKNLVKTLSIGAVTLTIMSSTVCAETLDNNKHVIELSNPNTGITIENNVGLDNVIKGCLITCGLDDLTVTNDNASIDDIVSDYEKLTKLTVSSTQLKTAKVEKDLAIMLAKSNNSSYKNIAEFLAKAKIKYLDDYSLNDKELKSVSKEYNIELNDYEEAQLYYILNNIKTFKYDKANLLNELNNQLPKETIIEKIINTLF